MDDDSLSTAREEYYRLNKVVRDYDNPTDPVRDPEWKRLLQRANRAREIYDMARERCGLPPV